MRIAQISPLMVRVPPKGYGGPERCVSYLTEELVNQGHEVTLFATADSITKAKLIPVCPYPLINKNIQELIVFHLYMIEQVFKQENDFDIIHNHVEYFPAPFARRHNTPMVSTLHTTINKKIEPLYQEFNEQALVAISKFQKINSYQWLNWKGVVYHGLPVNLYSFQPKPEKYLAYLGRLSPAKGILKAIEIAIKSGIGIKIAGNQTLDEESFYENEVKPLFKNSLVEYVGELNDKEKKDFLGNAYALLFPIESDEAFGLVMIEAMACGTPVIATKRSSVMEIVKDGITGFTFETIEEAISCVEKVPLLDRCKCREYFEKYFTTFRMAKEYITIFENMVHVRSE